MSQRSRSLKTASFSSEVEDGNRSGLSSMKEEGAVACLYLQYRKELAGLLSFSVKQESILL